MLRIVCTLVSNFIKPVSDLDTYGQRLHHKLLVAAAVNFDDLTFPRFEDIVIRRINVNSKSWC